MPKWTIGAASLLLLGFGALPLHAADDSATVSIINPAIEINGVKIKRISAKLDGYNLGSCDTDRPAKGNVCVKPHEISAGPHVLELILDPLTTSFFRASLKFTAGGQGDWVLDAQGLTVAGATQNQYFAMKGGHLAPVAGCAAALQRAAATLSCTVANLGAVAKALSEAAGECIEKIDDHDAASTALTPRV